MFGHPILSPSLLLAGLLAAPGFAQGPCPITRTGTPCRVSLDTSLTPSGSGLTLTASVHTEAKNAFGLLVFGNATTPVPLPMQNCLLAVQPVFLVPIATDSRGDATTLMPTPLDPGIGVDLQATMILGGLSMPDFGTSETNGLRLRSSGEYVYLPLNNSLLDASRSSLQQSSSWRPVELGGSGVLGAFDYTTLPTRGRDSKNRVIHEWNTDDFTSPAAETLTGEAIRVTNAVFEFSAFEIPKDVHIRCLGSKPVEIRVAGTIDVQGAVSVSAESMVRQLPSQRGQVGGLGGPGGSQGGNGGDNANLQPLNINGANGGGVNVDAAHPRSGQATAAAGTGSTANPANGQASAISWILIANTPTFCRQTAAGGAGGSGATQGTRGYTQLTSTPPTYPSTPVEFGAPATPGQAFPWLPISNTVASRVQFRIGGAGGGGGGTDPFYSFTGTPTWSPGSGGAGGGGVLHLSSGNGAVLGAAGDLLSLGGDAVKWGMALSTVWPAPGGGGSGGSILIQTLADPMLAGTIDVSGGQGGSYAEIAFLEMASFGGNGGAGFVRVEARSKPDETKLNLSPVPATTNNTGSLLALDHLGQSLVTSKWMRLAATQGTPFVSRYLIRGAAQGAPVAYSNDGRLATLGAEPGQWVVLHVQMARDNNGNPGATTHWQRSSELEQLGLDVNAGPWYRFALLFDGTTQTPMPNDLRVDSIEFWSSCR